MRVRACYGILSLAALLTAAGCAKSTTAPTVSTVAPQLQLPTNGTQVANQSQPVTLVVLNASGAPAGTTYTFEVASDVGFTTKVQTKDGVAQGASGQTSAQLDPLAASKDYFWRARGNLNGTPGQFSDPFKFTVGAVVTLAAPNPISPLTNAETSPRPALRVTNAARSGPTGPITYRFDVSRDSTFSSIIVSGTNTEGVNETGYIPTVDLPTRILVFWRAVAMDPLNSVTSAPSSIQSFTAIQLSQAEQVAQQLGTALWPGRRPTPDTGHATMGDRWEIQTLHYLPGNVFFQSPDIEMLRIFDLLDRGYDPNGAAAWMNSNGYPTQALWYPPPEKAVIGLKYVYLASRNKISVNGTWDVVLRVE